VTLRGRIPVCQVLEDFRPLSKFTTAAQKKKSGLCCTGCKECKYCTYGTIKQAINMHIAVFNKIVQLSWDMVKCFEKKA